MLKQWHALLLGHWARNPGQMAVVPKPILPLDAVIAPHSVELQPNRGNQCVHDTIICCRGNL